MTLYNQALLSHSFSAFIGRSAVFMYFVSTGEKNMKQLFGIESISFYYDDLNW